MTAKERLEAYKAGWRLQLLECGLDNDRVATIIKLADLNSLFDPLKMLYEIMPLAEDNRVSDEAIGLRLRSELLIGDNDGHIRTTEGSK